MKTRIAKQGMVNQLCIFENLPHVFTADGRDEASCLIDIASLENAIGVPRRQFIAG